MTIREAVFIAHQRRGGHTDAEIHLALKGASLDFPVPEPLLNSQIKAGREEEFIKTILEFFSTCDANMGTVGAALRREQTRQSKSN